MMDMDFETSYGWPVKRIAGVDEAGRGAWCGPVIAAAVVLPSDFDGSALRDSKKLSATKRQALRLEIETAAIMGVGIGIGMASVEEIDQLNILQASLLAMRRAIEIVTPDMAFVDGNQDPKLSIPSELIISGDDKVASIAAASIIAKQTRDDIMRDLARQFPNYNWHSNMGYGTKAHRAGLKEIGVSQHHRKTFAPIRAMLQG